MCIEETDRVTGVDASNIKTLDGVLTSLNYSIFFLCIYILVSFLFFAIRLEPCDFEGWDDFTLRLWQISNNIVICIICHFIICRFIICHFVNCYMSVCHLVICHVVTGHFVICRFIGYLYLVTYFLAPCYKSSCYLSLYYLSLYICHLILRLILFNFDYLSPCYLSDLCHLVTCYLSSRRYVICRFTCYLSPCFMPLCYMWCHIGLSVTWLSSKICTTVSATFVTNSS